MKEIIANVDKIQKALVVEARMGFKNAAVFGGFSAFATSWLDKINISLKKKDVQTDLIGIQNLVSLLGKYIQATNKEREQITGQLSGLLTTLIELVTKNRETVSATSINDTITDPTPEIANTTKTANTTKIVNSSPETVNNDCPPSELQFLKSVGPKRVRLLNNIGIQTVQDLLYHFPRRHEDRSILKKFHQLQDGEIETVKGTVLSCQDINPRKKLCITKVALHDGVSIGYAVWFNQPFIKKQLPQGTEMMVTGKNERKYGTVQISVMDFEIMDNDDLVHIGRIVPVYPTTEGLPPRVLRSIIKIAVDELVPVQDEFLPRFLLNKYHLMNLQEALLKIHYPEKMDDVEEAKRRLIFEELFLLQLGVCLVKSSGLREQGIKHKKSGTLVREFLDNLPFRLTKAQLRVQQEIFEDMEDIKPMNRLVQGDVGSGKTVVATAALVKTVESGYQGALMAPTEILASQHFEGLQELLEPLGVKLALLIGGLNKGNKKQIIQDIKEGRIDIVVGTHAIIQDEVLFQKLGLTITDEQHRFGVKQRAKLKEKGYNSDVLVMTATPIPRTLALTVYGDLDISVIDELPAGRQTIKTYWVKTSLKDRVYSFIREQVSLGRQVYYVCPLVEESEKIDVSAAVELAEFLQTKIFTDLRVGLIHGRLKQDDKNTVMREYKNGQIDILVATTVVEVGVNVPNSTLMIIEDADRFGLAQLHQLRGRVGRGSSQSYCVLVADPSTEEGRSRLKIMQATSDGFAIAEEDLKIRGPGEFFGIKQSGIPDLKIADIIRDVLILQVARDEAQKLISDSPSLNKPEYTRLKERMLEKYRQSDNYFRIC